MCSRRVRPARGGCREAAQRHRGILHQRVDGSAALFRGRAAGVAAGEPAVHQVWGRGGGGALGRSRRGRPEAVRHRCERLQVVVEHEVQPHLLLTCRRGREEILVRGQRRGAQHAPRGQDGGLGRLEQPADAEISEALAFAKLTLERQREAERERQCVALMEEAMVPIIQ